MKRSSNSFLILPRSAENVNKKNSSGWSIVDPISSRYFVTIFFSNFIRIFFVELRVLRSTYLSRNFSAKPYFKRIGGNLFIFLMPMQYIRLPFFLFFKKRLRELSRSHLKLTSLKRSKMLIPLPHVTPPKVTKLSSQFDLNV